MYALRCGSPTENRQYAECRNRIERNLYTDGKYFRDLLSEEEVDNLEMILTSRYDHGTATSAPVIYNGWKEKHCNLLTAGGHEPLCFAIDDDSTAWRRALAEHGLDYRPQVLSCESANSEALYFTEEADLTNLYREPQIPCLILIDREDRISARWMRITQTAEFQLEKKLH